MEYFDVVDEKGNPTGEIVEREQAHRSGIRHRTAHIWVIRTYQGKAEVLLQKRCMNKDSFPGCLDTSSAGHIQAGDEPLPSAVRELYEELGIQAREEELTFIGQFPISYRMNFHGSPFIDEEVSNVYLYDQPVDISSLVLQPEEVESVVWEDMDETIQQLKKHNPAYCVPYDGIMLLKNYLISTHYMKEK